MKICKKCEIEKELKLFYSHPTCKYGVRSICIECCKNVNTEYYSNNKEYIDNQSKQYNLTNYDNLKTYHKNYNLNNRHKKNAYVRSILQTNPLFKLSSNIRSLIRKSFNNRGVKKNTKSEQILGCTFEEFMLYLENQFDKHMNWSNHGIYWELDHIKPISLAINEQELIELNKYTNFQPLEKSLNRLKSNKY